MSTLTNPTSSLGPSRAPAAADDPELARFNRSRFGFAAGVGAALGMLVLLAILRLLSGAESMVEVFADWLLYLLPGATFSYIIDNLQHSAKPLLYLGIVIGVLLVGGLIGRWYATAPGLRFAMLLAVAGWLLFGFGVYVAAGDGVFGADLQTGALWNGLSLLFLFVSFATLLFGLFRVLEARATPAGVPDRTRRTALAGSLAALAVAVVGGWLWRILPEAGASGGSGGGVLAAAQPAGAAPAAPDAAAAALIAQANAAPFNVSGLSPEVTATKDFYEVSKNFIDPHVDAAGWSLKIEGLVDTPFQLNYQSLTQLPAVEGAYTLMCISNEVGGNLWGNAIWRGVPIKSLLDQAGVQAGAKKAVFTAADNYQDSVKIENVLNPEALIVWEMNGQPLAPEHGFPARLLIPGIYGMKNVKWITSIKLVTDDFQGYWQERGWDDPAPYQTASRIDTPSGRSSVNAGTVPIAGVAFAGNRGISKVEVSVDDGQTWLPAQLKPPLGDNAWQLWLADVPLTGGSKLIKVRATDGTGALQTPQDADPFPSGSTGYHTIRVGVNG